MSLAPPRPPHLPLTALRAFESAARHESFLKAAEEMSLTPGAIAQQVKKLEDWAGAPLFTRHARGVSLTPTARDTLTALSEAFEHLGRAAQSLRLASAEPVLRIAALPAIAQLWLSPRLSLLYRAHPALSLSTFALETCPPLDRGDFDLGLFFLEPEDIQAPGIHRLAQDHLTPVAAPAIAAQIQAPADLREAVLIHDAAWSGEWPFWCEAVGLTRIASERGPTHSLYSIAVDRCAAGDGVLIGHTALIGDRIAAGDLVVLFPALTQPGHSLCLMTAPDRENALLTRIADCLAAETSD